MTVFIAVSAGVYLLDASTKILIRKCMPLHSEISILPFFSLVHVQNTGIAFGLFQEKNFLFLVVGLAMAVLIFFLGRSFARESSWNAAAFGLILGGALGNITDRVVFGRVTDFLDFFVAAHHWPAFNVADSSICVGAGMMILGGIFQQKSRAA